MEDSLKPIQVGISTVNANFKALAKAILLPVFAYVAILAVMQVGGVSSTGLWILRIASLIPVTLIAVTTHRIILKGPESVPTWGINRFGWREIKFTLCQYVILIFLLPLIVFLYIPFIGVFLGFIVGAYMVGRMSLVFPSIAIDKKFDFKDSWDATKGHKLMMFVVVAVFPFFLGVFEFMLGRIQGITFALQLVSLFATVYIVAALSIAYQIVMEPESAR